MLQAWHSRHPAARSALTHRQPPSALERSDAACFHFHWDMETITELNRIIQVPKEHNNIRLL